MVIRRDAYLALTAAVTTIYASLVTLKIMRPAGNIFYFNCSTGSICHHLFTSPDSAEAEYFFAIKNCIKSHTAHYLITTLPLRIYYRGERGNEIHRVMGTVTAF
jgi:hypothetical protein